MPDSSAVLVTGASTGIGAACALRLDRLGYQVFAGVRDPAASTRLKAASSHRLVPLFLDVTRTDQIETAVATITTAVGSRGLNGLVNNAGIGLGGPIEFVPVDQVRRLFEVNVFGLLAVTQACLPLLRLARGRVVNMGSIAGKTVSPFVAPYCMSKHAVEALTDGLRLELAEAGIEVAVIEPGAVRTPIWGKGIAALGQAPQTLPAAAIERYGARLRSFEKVLEGFDRKGVAPEVVAEAVVHALESRSPKTRYLVGADARVRSIIGRFLPDRLVDALVRAAVGRMERQVA